MGIASPLAVLQLTDIHILADAQDEMLGINTENYFLKILALAFANQARYDLILVTGDLTQDPCPASYTRLQQHLAACNLPVLFLPGNHDDTALMRQYLQNDQIRGDKHRLFDHWQVINLDSQIPGEPNGRLAAGELAFLADSLSQYPDHHALIALHHHCLPVHSQWMDSMLIDNSAAFLALLSQFPQVKTVVNGHIHQEFSFFYQDIHFLGAPSTCFQFTPKSPDFSIDRTAPGFRSLQLFPDGRIATSVSRLAGQLMELTMDGKGYLDHP